MLPQRAKLLGAFLLLLVASGFTYLPGFYKPAAFFWDENFHIPSAQRYMNGVFFMEPHPPLGKLLIAAGEWLLNADNNDAVFIAEEYAKDPPEGFSFAGYRLFPVVCGALLGPTLFLLIFFISGSFSLSVLTGMLPIFDNALIVHSRGAMLDPPLLLSIVAGTLFYHLSLKKFGGERKACLLIYLTLFSFSCGTAVSIKMNGAILLIFAVHLLLHHRRSLNALMAITLPAIITFFSVWWLHFSLASRIEPKLPENGLFEVSDSFAEKVRNGDSRKISSLLEGIKEATAFTKRYQDGVPPLDFCKDDENGSLPLLWPVGVRTINYRWETIGDLTRYLYLIANPVSWGLGIVGVLTALLYTLISFRNPSRHATAGNYAFIPLVLCAYSISWLSPYLIPRVFYLYHYFIPLIFSWILFGTVAANFLSTAITLVHLFLAISITGTFLWLSPLTYYLPLSRQELESRSLFPSWDLRYQNTPSYFLSHCRENIADRRRSLKEWHLSIGDLSANYIEQGVGTPQQLSDGLSITTNSRIQFPINKRFSTIRGKVVLQTNPADVVATLEIKLDGITVWKESLSMRDESGKTFDLPIATASVLTLESKSGSPENNPVNLLWKELAITPLSLGPISGTP